jgi:hypothetical protein
MPASVIAGQLEQLLTACGWKCSANRFTLNAIEPGVLKPVQHKWMAGEAAKINNGEIAQVRPSQIIVQDHAPQAEIDRLVASLEAAHIEPSVTTVTEFVDLLWDAPSAAQRARRDSELKDPLFRTLFKDLRMKGGSPDDRHAPQKVLLGNLDVSDHRLFDLALPTSGTWFALLADAGLGKSELLQWNEWRYSVFYESARSQRARSLPPIAIRVPLRGMRMLSLDAIAHYLSRPDLDDDLPALSRLNSGASLLQLLRMGRIILLLDGVDELMITREKLEDGLKELQKAVNDGGRIVLAARRGHLITRRTLEDVFPSDQIARIEPMPPAAGQRLLEKYGAPDDHAQKIVRRLQGSEAQGIPLFLLMAYALDLSSPLESSVLESKTNVLAELLRLFCRREESRLDITTNDQMRLLTEFAHWTSIEGDLQPATALELLGLDAAEPAAKIVLNPHALLTRAANDSIQFKYPNFKHFFSAKALAEDWAQLGFSAVVGDLRSHKLEEETIEYMARLVDPIAIAAAWAYSEQEDVKRTPLVRRNVLALALARLEDDEPGSSHTARSNCLAGLLGSRVVTDVSLADLVLVRLDLAGWTLARLNGRGGSMQYCVNLARCDFDETISTVDLDGTELPQDPNDSVAVLAGADRLRRMLSPLRRRGSDLLIKMLNVSECRDADGWKEMRRAGYATIQRRSGGERNWVLNDGGHRVMNAFMQADGKPPRALRTLLDREPKLRSLLLALSRR